MVAGAVVSYDCTLNGVLGDFTNSATATGTDASGSDVTSTDTVRAGCDLPADPGVQDPKQPVRRRNGGATFTITVTNVGDDPLTDVTVSDPLAPNCDSVIGDLPANTSTSYDCTLSPITGDFTNTADVSGSGSPARSSPAILLDLGDLFGGDGLVVAEVEAEPVGPDPRTLLLDVVAEDLAQGPVQEVGGGVVASDRGSPLVVDGGGHLLADLDRTVDLGRPRGRRARRPP